MKLIYYIILRITLALTFILTVWAIFFYVTMIDEVNDEVDDALKIIRKPSLSGHWQERSYLLKPTAPTINII